MDKSRTAFDRSLESLEIAELLIKTEHYSDSISHSYYAVFHAAQSLLIKKEIETRTHSGAIHQFGLTYVVNNDFNPEIAKTFSQLEDLRENVDYDYSIHITKKKAIKDLNNAKLFVKECKKFL